MTTHRFSSGAARGRRHVESFAELDYLYRTAPVGLCLVDRDLRFLRINDRLAALHDLPIQGHIGRTLREVLPGIALEIEPVLRRVVATGEPVVDLEFEGAARGTPPEGRHWRTTCQPLKADDGTVREISIAMQDVTAQRRAEQTLHESEARFRTLVEHSADAICILDADTGRFIDYNQKALDLFGLTGGQFLSVGPAELSPPQPDGRPAAEAVAEKLAAAVEGRQLTFEWTHLHADGRHIPCEIRLVRLPSRDRTLFRGSISDITERRRTERLQAGTTRVLERLAKGDALTGVLNELTLTINSQQAGMRCSILLLDDDGQHLHHVPGPDLPKPYTDAIDGLKIGPAVGSCGTAAHRRERVIVADTLEDPLWERYRDLARRFGLRACWSQPIFSRTGKVLGTFAIYHDRPCLPGEAEVRLIEQAAYLAGVAIEHTRANQSLREGEAALRLSHEQLQQLTGKLLSAQEEERRRVARELHDDLSQRLAILAIDAAILEESIPARSTHARTRLGGLRSDLVKLSEDVHGLSRRLHPSIIDDLGLVDAVASECARFSEREGIEVEFIPRDIPERLPRDLAFGIYRIIQEGLRNISKHSRAAKAEVTLARADRSLRLIIQDRGAGFDPVRTRGKGGLGLASMEERARLLRGRLQVRSRAGHGTTIELEVDLPDPPAS